MKKIISLALVTALSFAIIASAGAQGKMKAKTTKASPKMAKTIKKAPAKMAKKAPSKMAKKTAKKA